LLDSLLQELDMSVFEFRDACEAGQTDKVLSLINQVDKNEIDQDGYNGLHLAADNGQLDVVNILLEAGADINRVVYDGALSALHLALSKRNFDVARKLIEAGCDINLVSQIGVSGTALHYAIIKDNLDMVKLLLEKKADVNIVEEETGYSPLFLAASREQVDMMHVLLGAGPDVNLADYEGKTPLHFAAANGFGEVIKLLVDHKADVTIKNGDDETAEDVAKKVKENEIVAFLQACALGNIPADAPKPKVREQREFRTVIPLEGCGEGCAVPE